MRRLARERGIDLAHAHRHRSRRPHRAARPRARVRREAGVPDPESAPAPASAAGTADSVAGFTDVPLTGMRRAIARRLTESKTTVPHFYVTAHCRVDRLFALRAEVNEAAERKVSVNDFVLKAVAGALRDVPAANAIWGGDHIRRFDGVDLAIAVAVDGGLLTPVLRGGRHGEPDRRSARRSRSSPSALARASSGRRSSRAAASRSRTSACTGSTSSRRSSTRRRPGILAVSAAKQQPVVDDGAARGRNRHDGHAVGRPPRDRRRGRRRVDGGVRAPRREPGLAAALVGSRPSAAYAEDAKAATSGAGMPRLSACARDARYALAPTVVTALDEALAGLGVEGVHVLLDGGDDHLVAGVRVDAAVDARHDVDAVAVDLGVTVEVAVGAELLDDVDLDLQALARCRDLDVFGADADRDLAAGCAVEQDVAVDLGDRAAELDATVGEVGR